MSASSHSSAAIVLNMSASAGVNLEPQAVASIRSLSSLVCESDDSDFEFDLSEVSSDEPPASPQLLSFSPQWKSAASISMLMPTTSSSTEAHVYTAAPNIHHLYVMDIAPQDADAATINSPQKCYNYDGAIDVNEQILSRDGGCRKEAFGADLLHVNGIPHKSQPKRRNLRSLMLERRELEQLHALIVAHRSINGSAALTKNDEVMNLRGSSSCNSPSEVSSESASPSPQHHKKKSRRWSLKLDFLHSKKASSPSKAGDHSDQDRAFHDYAWAMFDDELSDTNYQDAAEIRDRNSGPSRRSASISSRSNNAENDMGGRKSTSASAPVSPVSSPSHCSPSISPAQSGPHGSCPASPPAGGVTRRPMSPYAHHYQQQRARARELQRRTVLPYRHSLLGACFFPSPSPARPQVAY